MTLLMAIHCHQPVGNFGFVFEEAYAKAYEPFLSVLERHQAVRLALHYSGCLLDWLAEHRPELLRRLRALVSRGQVELLASGYYEPIL
ncbi:MAG: alpha-amylase, partial [Candidatus Omnitrophica bacterium]|nr:alpha-amylase [Candidatus Omnitrophota bacterium]